MLPGCYSAGYERRAFVVCGRKLQPFTLGHARVLYLADSPFVVAGKDAVTADDLLLAVAVCTYAEPPAADSLRQLAAEGLRMAAADLKTEIEQFGEYLRYWTARHPRWEDKPAAPTIPWPWSYASLLEAEYGYTEAQAWKATCADAFWKGAAWSHRNGGAELMTLEQLAVKEMMDNE